MFIRKRYLSFNMSLITLDSDLTAVEVAKVEVQKLRIVVRDLLERRLKACKQEIDDDGNILFIEPPDMKWYIKEYRETLKVESQLEAEKKRDDHKAAVDLVGLMQQQMKMDRKDKQKYRVIEVDVENEDG